MQDGGVGVVEVRVLPPLRSIREWVAFVILKITAGVMLLNGLSMVVSVLPLLGFAGENPGLRTAAYGMLWLSIAFVLSGWSARYLGRTPRPLFPNEREARAQPAALGAWALALVASLLLLPVTTFHELAPLKSLWRDMFHVINDNNVFAGVLDAPQFSGVILVPVAATVLVPLFEILAAIAYAGSSLVLLLLLWSRSFRFPRAYLMCLLLQASLVFASVYGADLAGDVAQWVAREAGTTATHMRTSEVVQVLDAVQRYDRVLRSTGLSVLWTFGGYVLWLPILLRWRPALEAFAVDAADPADTHAAAHLRSAATPSAQAQPQDVANLSPEARRRFYEEAARELQGAGATVAPRKGLRLALVWAVIGGMFMVFAIVRAVTQIGALRHSG